MINASFLVDDSLWMKSSQPFILILLKNQGIYHGYFLTECFVLEGFFGWFLFFFFQKKEKVKNSGDEPMLYMSS